MRYGNDSSGVETKNCEAMRRGELKTGAGFMLALMVALLMCCGSLLTSCGSHKSNLKQETSIESGGGHQRKDTASLSQQTKKTETEDATEETEEVTTVYDTSKPADPSTGKPPVLSETKKTTKKGTNKKKDESSNITLNQSSEEQSNDSTKIKDRTEETKKKQETTVPKQISGMLWALAALVGLVIVGWLVYKSRNNKSVS